MVRHPHTVTVNGAAVSTLDDNGNWIAGSPDDALVLVGRYEPQTNAAISGTDGSIIKVNGIVYLPQTAPKLNIGASVVVMNGAEQVAKATVKQFERSQINARIWL